MSEKQSLEMQIACLRHCIAAANQTGNCEQNVIDGAEQAVETLEWVKRNASAIREVVRLMKEAPAVLQIITTFPGSKVEVRERWSEFRELYLQHGGMDLEA